MIESLSYDVILGRDFLKEFCFKVDFENGSVNFPPEPDPLLFKGLHLNDDKLMRINNKFHWCLSQNS